MSLRLLGLFISIPMTITVMFIVLNSNEIMSLLIESKNNLCPNNNPPPKPPLFEYRNALCVMGIIDPPLLITTLGLIIIAVEVLAAIYYVNTERKISMFD